jgi:hypothetical protein
MELKKRKIKTSYGTEGICLFDNDNIFQGESIIIDYNKNWVTHGFFRSGFRIGKIIITDRISGNIISQVYYPLRSGFFTIISEEEYRKELALLRFGKIECPQLNYLLKDYEFEDGK